MMITSKYRRLASDTALFAISNFGSKLLVFLLTPLYTSLLSTEQYGIADLINVTINLAYPVLTLAISDAVLRFTFEKDISKSKVLTMSLCVIMGSVVFLTACYPLVKQFNFMPTQYWKVFIVTYAMFNIHNCFANFVKGLEKTKLFALQGLIQTVTIIACNIYFLLILRAGLDGYLASIIIGYLVPTLVMLFGGSIYRYLRPIEFDGKLLKDMLKYCIPMIPTILSWAINSYFDKYMIIALIGLSDSGLYSVAHKIPTILTTCMSVFTQAWQISAISNYGSDNESEYYTKVYKIYGLFCLFLCMLIIPFSKPISRLLFAGPFFEAWRYIPMLMISALFSLHAAFLAAAFRASKKTNSLLISISIGCVINIILNYILLREIGTVGAAIATAFSFMVVWILRLITVQKIVQIKINKAVTSLSCCMLIISSMLLTFEVKYSYLIYIVLSIITVILYRRDIHDIACSLNSFLKKVANRNLNAK